MQRDERDVRPYLTKPVDEVGTDVDRHHLVTEPVQRVLHARARPQRDVALERPPALEHGDPHPAFLRSSTTFSERGGAGFTPVSVE